MVEQLDIQVKDIDHSYHRRQSGQRSNSHTYYDISVFGYGVFLSFFFALLHVYQLKTVHSVKMRYPHRQCLMILGICRCYKFYFTPGLPSHRWFWLRRRQLVPLDGDEKEPPRQMPRGPNRHASVRGSPSPTQRQAIAGADLRAATTS